MNDPIPRPRRKSWKKSIVDEELVGGSVDVLLQPISDDRLEHAFVDNNVKTLDLTLPVTSTFVVSNSPQVGDKGDVVEEPSTGSDSYKEGC